MGLFDYLKCEVKLPKASKEIEENIFQTKDFENSLDTYIITKKRKLVLISKNKRKTISFHGDITFYTCTGEHKTKDFKWYQYVARFTHGKLEYIKKVKNKIKP